MSYILARDNALVWDRIKEQGNELIEGRQGRSHVWAALKLKPRLTELEYVAACRAVLECSAAFDGMRQALGERVDNSGSDFGLAARVSAARSLENLRQAVGARVNQPRASACAEWLCQLWSLSEIAKGLGLTTITGTPPRTVPNARAAGTFVRKVLAAMAAYYDDLDADKGAWNAPTRDCA